LDILAFYGAVFRTICFVFFTSIMAVAAILAARHPEYLLFYWRIPYNALILLDYMLPPAAAQVDNRKYI